MTAHEEWRRTTAIHSLTFQQWCRARETAGKLGVMPDETRATHDVEHAIKSAKVKVSPMLAQELRAEAARCRRDKDEATAIALERRAKEMEA